MTSPKTEHHEGGESRMVPIFPELLQYLLAAAEVEPRGEFVIALRRSASANLRTRFKKIIRRAGLEPWPKPFQNLRATRQTELAEHFPAHVACAWMGNSQTVATEHYLQVTDEHFDRAATPKRAAEMMQHRQTSENAPTSSDDHDLPKTSGNREKVALCSAPSGTDEQQKTPRNRGVWAAQDSNL